MRCLTACPTVGVFFRLIKLSNPAMTCYYMLLQHAITIPLRKGWRLGNPSWAGEISHKDPAYHELKSSKSWGMDVPMTEGFSYDFMKLDKLRSNVDYTHEISYCYTVYSLNQKAHVVTSSRQKLGTQVLGHRFAQAGMGTGHCYGLPSPSKTLPRHAADNRSRAGEVVDIRGVLRQSACHKLLSLPFNYLFVTILFPFVFLSFVYCYKAWIRNVEISAGCLVQGNLVKESKTEDLGAP